MKYSASVYNKFSGSNQHIREQEHNTKAEFIEELRRNGYRVNPAKVKRSEVFDHIVNKTDCSPEDWKRFNTLKDIRMWDWN